MLRGGPQCSHREHCLGAENSRVIDQCQGKELQTHSHSPQTSAPAAPQQINTSTIEVQDTHDKKPKRPSTDSKQPLTETSEQLSQVQTLLCPHGEQMNFCSEILKEHSSENANIKSTKTMKTQNKGPANRQKVQMITLKMRA